MSALSRRIAREDEFDRLAALLREEAGKSDRRIRAAFHEAALGLMAWEDPPLMTPREYRRLELIHNVYRPHDPQGEVEPFDIDADWEEKL